jgi:hypothetical protein
MPPSSDGGSSEGSDGPDGSVATDASLEVGVEAAADATPDVSADAGSDAASDSALDTGSDSASDSEIDSGPPPVPLPPLSAKGSSLGCTFTGPSEAADQDLAATLSATWPPICTTDGWCWENPLPAGGKVPALWGFGSTDVWVGLEADRVLHWNGTSFDDEVPGVVVASLWGTSSTDLFAGGAVGSAGGIAHRTAQGWSVWPTTFPVVAVHGTSSTDAWAAAGNEVLHWNGSSWTSTGTLPTSTDLVDVHAYAPNDVWAISSDPEIYRWDGSVWSETPVSWTPVARLGGTGSNDVWMAAQQLASPPLGVLLHWDGSTWTGFGPDSEAGFHGAFWTFAPNDVWFKTGQGHFWQFDGTAWHWATQIGGGFSSLWASAPGDVWIGGGGGVPGYHSLTRGSVCSWAPAIHGLATSFERIHGSAADDVWVTAGYQRLLRNDGSGWRLVVPPLAIGTPRGVFAVAKNDAWVAGGSEVARWNGTSWTEFPLSIGLVHGLHGSAANDIWAVGGGGVCHFDGVTWNCGSTPTGLWSVWSVAPGHAWAIPGSGSAVWKYDSTQGGWSQIPGWTAGWSASSIYAPSSNEAWVTRGDGGLVHIHGGVIDDMVLPIADANAQSAFGFANDNVYIATDKGILHWNGTSLIAETWTSWAVPTAIWGTSDDMLVIAGWNGAILRRTQ